MAIHFCRKSASLLCALVLSFSGAAVSIGAAEETQAPVPPEKVVVSIDGTAVLPSFGTRAGSWFYSAGDDSSQLLLLGFPKAGVEQEPNYRLTADLNSQSFITLTVPSGNLPNAVSSQCFVRNLGTADVLVGWLDQPGSADALTTIPSGQELELSAEYDAANPLTVLKIQAPEFGDAASCSVEISRFQYQTAPVEAALSLEPVRKEQSLDPIATSPNFRPSLAKALVEWDWRMQDGVGTEREPRTYLQALEQRLPQGRALIDDLQKTLDDGAYENLEPFDENICDNFEALADCLDGYKAAWKEFEESFESLKSAPSADEKEAEELWRQVHALKRSILVNSPYFQFDSLVFFKFAPTIMSHQLTQVYGYVARPGGGIFTLERNEADSDQALMVARDITPPNLPLGSYMTPELSFDGSELYFAYCETPTTPNAWRDPDVMDRRFHLYKTPLDPTGAKRDAIRLTDGDYDDFSPLLMPDGDLVFCSTRRGGYHRCGAGPCYVYTLARAKGDGSDARPISFHETHEWFPTLAHNGRIVYTRWDYVDRDAVYYQQLWSTRQDGTDVRIFYGNNTFNPPGMWEPKAIPGSDKIVAVAGAHHAMSAGSVVMLDVAKGVDGTEPVKRLTPDVRFPEGEAPVPGIPQLPTLCDFDYVPGWFWYAGREADRVPETPEERRWPVHSFKSPFPLAEKYFVASYSFDQLLGEAGPNLPNQFGIYFCDAFGNRELVYRDPNISSLWATPARPRPVPPVVASALDKSRQDPESPTGTFYLQNVYESWPTQIPAKIKALRIVQVLPKTTPNANQPMVGAASASPGKQVLGTVPVEEDGSAFFEAPAKTPILFQALDENGRMVQGMRSLVYLQPGESAGCVGCHEDRMATVANTRTVASTKQPATIAPGPDGSKPLSYPILVQPLLDQKCASCHNAEKPEGGVVLTGEIDGTYTKSYNALINYVSFTYWGAPDGNKEPRTEPDAFGARPSKLTQILESGHYDVELTPEEWERLNVWIDANALFYGTFNVEDQAKQQRGERIAGPDLE